MIRLICLFSMLASFLIVSGCKDKSTDSTPSLPSTPIPSPNPSPVPTPGEENKDIDEATTQLFDSAYTELRNGQYVKFVDMVKGIQEAYRDKFTQWLVKKSQVDNFRPNYGLLLRRDLHLNWKELQKFKPDINNISEFYGLTNTRNDCWFLSSLQLMAGTSAYDNLLEIDYLQPELWKRTDNEELMVVEDFLQTLREIIYELRLGKNTTPERIDQLKENHIQSIFRIGKDVNRTPSLYLYALNNYNLKKIYVIPDPSQLPKQAPPWGPLRKLTMDDNGRLVFPEYISLKDFVVKDQNEIRNQRIPVTKLSPQAFRDKVMKNQFSLTWIEEITMSLEKNKGGYSEVFFKMCNIILDPYGHYSRYLNLAISPYAIRNIGNLSQECFHIIDGNQVLSYFSYSFTNDQIYHEGDIDPLTKLPFIQIASGSKYHKFKGHDINNGKNITHKMVFSSYRPKVPQESLVGNLLLKGVTIERPGHAMSAFYNITAGLWERHDNGKQAEFKPEQEILNKNEHIDVRIYEAHNL